MPHADDMKERDKLLLLTALLFAVRLFRKDHTEFSGTAVSQEEMEKWTRLDRERRAYASAADAQAIIKAVAALDL